MIGETLLRDLSPAVSAPEEGIFLWQQGGHRVSLENPQPEQIRLEDIAWNLSGINRWNGAGYRVYSVAEHSILVTEMLPKVFYLRGLLHDAHEAYTGDTAAPVKRMLGPELKHLEMRLDAVIGERLGVDLVRYAGEDHILNADLGIAVTEGSVLVGVPEDEIARHFREFKNIKPPDSKLIPKGAPDRAFIADTFYRLACGELGLDSSRKARAFEFGGQ